MAVVTHICRIVNGLVNLPGSRLRGDTDASRPRDAHLRSDPDLSSAQNGGLRGSSCILVGAYGIYVTSRPANGTAQVIQTNERTRLKCTIPPTTATLRTVRRTKTVRPTGS